MPVATDRRYSAAMPQNAPATQIDFATDPGRYRHWRLEFDGAVAGLVLDVDPAGGLFPGTELKLNSYDLGVDIELADAVTRLRFEHPEVRAVVLRSAKPNVFCAGANIGALARASHAHKVNFCKFTNETRLAIEDASENSGQRYLAAVSGTAAGGGYELALACDHIMLIDDRRSSVSLPEVALLGVLPGTGGLTRLTDKRRVRHDLADVFCTSVEGVRGQRAVAWRLVDAAVRPSEFAAFVADRARALAATRPRPAASEGVALPCLQRRETPDGLAYTFVAVAIDRAARTATFTVTAPVVRTTQAIDDIMAAGAAWWPLAMARELDDAILCMRSNELDIGTWILKTHGDASAVLAADAALRVQRDHWFVREVIGTLRRTLAR